MQTVTLNASLHIDSVTCDPAARTVHFDFKEDAGLPNYDNELHTTDADNYFRFSKWVEGYRSEGHIIDACATHCCFTAPANTDYAHYRDELLKQLYHGRFFARADMQSMADTFGIRPNERSKS